MNRSLPFLPILFLALFTFACGEGQPEPSAASEANPAPGTKPGVPVEALVIKTRTVAQNVSFTGVLQPIHSVEIVAEVSGKIERIHKKLGDRVTPRDTLAVVDDEIPSSQYRQARAQVLSAENNVKIAQLNYESDRQLLEAGDISKLTYEQALLAVKTAEAQHLAARANLSLMEKTYRDTRITSPIAGLIARKYIELGTMVTPLMPLYRVVDLAALKVEVAIPQTLISRIHTGNPVGVTLSALKDRTFPGQIRTISPQADESTGAFAMEVHVRNTEDLKIRAGMTARTDLRLSEKHRQLVIPDYALVSKNRQHYVYKIAGGVARLADIDIAETVGAQVVVESGLALGDTIVVVGMKNLGLETPVWIETLH